MSVYHPSYIDLSLLAFCWHVGQLELMLHFCTVAQSEWRNMIQQDMISRLIWCCRFGFAKSMREQRSPKRVKRSPKIWTRKTHRKGSKTFAKLTKQITSKHKVRPTTYLCKMSDLKLKKTNHFFLQHNFCKITSLFDRIFCYLLQTKPYTVISKRFLT